MTIFGIKRWSECNTCKLCEKTCHWGAIEGPKIIMTECVRCDDCERLYMDQQKCPHWIIIRRKSRASRRQPPVPSVVVGQVHRVPAVRAPPDSMGREGGSRSQSFRHSRTLRDSDSSYSIGPFREFR